MPKQSLIYLLMSIFIVIFSKYAQMFFIYIDIFYTNISIKIAPLFSSTFAGTTLRGIVILTLTPLLITAIPAIAYRLAKGSMIPYYYEANWLIWFTIVVAKILVQ